MSLAANALITLKEFKDWIGVATADAEEDARNEAAINVASQIIETHCGRKFITPGSALAEIFDGMGTGEAYTVNRPIVAVSGLSYRTGASGSTWTSVYGVWTYETNLTEGRIYFTDGNLFSKGKDNWKINYTYGYAITSVPQDLKMACAMLAARFKKQFEDGIHGQTSRTFGDQNIGYDFSKIPDTILCFLHKYRRMIA